MIFGPVSPNEIPQDGYTQTYLFKSGRFKPKEQITAPLVKELGAKGPDDKIYQYMEWADGKKALLEFYDGKPGSNYKLRTNYEVELLD